MSTEQEPSQAPETPPQTPQPSHQQDVEKMSRLKNARTLMMITAIAAPVSMIIGGVPLSTVALVCGIVALVKIRGLIRDYQVEDAWAHRMTISCIIVVCVAALALILNAINLIMIWPYLMDIVQSDSLESLLGSSGDIVNAGSSAPQGGSVWG